MDKRVLSDAELFDLYETIGDTGYEEIAVALKHHIEALREQVAALTAELEQCKPASPEPVCACTNCEGRGGRYQNSGVPGKPVWVKCPKCHGTGKSQESKA